MQESSGLPERIERLIVQLEDEVIKLSAFHRAEINRIQEDNATELQQLNLEFERRLSTANAGFHARIADLEKEIEYMKELNMAQRMMMEDSVGYIKGLEEKIAAIRSRE